MSSSTAITRRPVGSASRAAARLSATPQRVSDHAPAFGQHSDEIARELSLDPAALRESSVIF